MMKMRSELKKERKNKIIISSAKIFSENGYNNTKTSDISKDAKIASGTLFNYFPTKIDLLNKTYEAAMFELIEILKSNKETTMKNKLRYFWNETIDYYIKKPYFINFIIIFENSPLITEEIHKKINLNNKYLSEILYNIKEKDEDTFELIPNIILSTLFSTFKYIEKNPEKDIDKIKKNSFNYLWNGINNST